MKSKEIQFNAEQQKVIQYNHSEAGPLLVLAGPGSGKTAVLIERIHYLIEEGIKAEKILAITFTRSAVNEMKERLSLRCGIHSKDVFFCTFHALALHILVQEGLRNKREPELKTLLSDCLKVLSDNKKVRNRWSSRWEIFLVDELQDIDSQQLKILKILSINKKGVFAVGDDDQAIYQFRGATPEVIQNFRSNFPNSSTLKLEKNYRSNPAIIRMANRIFSNKEKEFRKKLVSCSLRNDLLFRKRNAVQVIKTKKVSQELYLINKTIRQFRLKYDLKWNDFAFLLRNNHLVEYYSSALEYMGLPVGSQNNPGGIQVMTIHASKGLQFPVVFCAGLSVGIFPKKGGAKMSEEEKRLFYVAVTRAESSLQLLFCQKMVWMGNLRFFQESPFLWYGKPLVKRIPKMIAGWINNAFF